MMCEWGNTKALQLKIGADLSYTGKDRWAWKEIDSCIAGILQALQRAGIDMRYSCCGHGGMFGNISLQDGRVLLIATEELHTQQGRYLFKLWFTYVKLCIAKKIKEIVRKVKRVEEEENESNTLNEHQAIVDAFFKDLLASSPKAGSFYNKPYLAFPHPIFGIDTKPGYIFDDVFWDVFHAHPLHVCHVTRLTDGPQFDEERVFEIRFKVDGEGAGIDMRGSCCGHEEHLDELEEADD